MIELNTFKKNNPGAFISWVKGFVAVDGKTYKIKFVNVGGKKFPYVDTSSEVEKVDLSDDDRFKIKVINEAVNKDQLKNVHYDFDGEYYFVIGIGGKAVKAYKNDDKEFKYFWFNNKEGHFLLNKLYGVVQEQSLLV